MRVRAPVTLVKRASVALAALLRATQTEHGGGGGAAVDVEVEGEAGEGDGEGVPAGAAVAVPGEAVIEAAAETTPAVATSS